jgi:hypothetical protein
MQPRLQRWSWTFVKIKKYRITTSHAQHPNTNTFMNTFAIKNTRYALVLMRKHHSDTKAQTHLHTHTHTTHLHTGEDGETCSACSAGKYKPDRGSVECSTCPLNSNSSDASTNLSDCKCIPGYTGEDEHPRQTQHTNTHNHTCTKRKYQHAHTHIRKHKHTFHTHDTAPPPPPPPILFIRKHQTDTNHKLIYKHMKTPHNLYTTHISLKRNDGGSCLAFSAGKYKVVTSSSVCSTCPLNANSSAASTSLRDSKWGPGYTGEDEHPRHILKTTSRNHTCTAPKYKYTHKSTQRTRHN